MDEWEVHLGEHCLKIGSGATPRGGKDTYLSDSPYALIRSQNIYNERFTRQGLAFISDQQAAQLQNVEVQEGDVLLNITGDSVARACQVNRDILPARVNQHVAIIRPKPERIDSRFLRYFLITPKMQNHMLALASGGATRKALTKGMIKNFKIPDKPIAEQRAIAEMLGALDDKIELNRRMNETLEAMAQAIFKDWFVDFGPTRAKMEGLTPYLAPALWSLFPDTLNADGIPQGWAIKKISDLGEVVTGKTPSTKNKAFYGDDVPFIMIPDMYRKVYVTSTAKRLSKLGADSQKNKYLPKNSIIVSCIATPGLVTLTHQRCQTNQQINALIPFNLHYSAFYFFSLRKISANIVAEGSGGSVFYNMNKRQFCSLEVLIPQKEIIDEFCLKTNALLESILCRELQNQTLAALRDLLLPRLMSGKLRVRGL